MAEGGRIEPGPAAPAAGPGPVPGPIVSMPVTTLALFSAHAAALVEEGKYLECVEMAEDGRCNCRECVWLGRVLRLLRAVSP